MAARILQAALREDTTLSELSVMARAEPVFAGRVLRWVNSAAHQRRREVLDVEQAASLLGVRGIRTVALSMVVADMVPPAPAARVLLVNGLRRALIAQHLARRAALERQDAAFTTGLFLEAGLMTQASQDLDRAIAMAASPAEHRPLRERAEGLVPHPASGANLAIRFGLPTELVSAVREHHAAAVPEPELSRLAWASERVASLFEGGYDDASRRRATDALATLDLAPPVLDDVLEAVPVEIQQTAEVFEREVGAQPTWQELLADAQERLREMSTFYEGMVAALEQVIDDKERILREREQLSRDLEVANARLEALSLTDPLTELPNRRALDGQLDQALARADRGGGEVALAMLDLDHFKRLNDTHGHDAGDEVLREVARRLRSALREQDLIARFGGEEFVVVMPDTGLEAARACAERLRAVVGASPVSFRGATLSVTTSVGLAVARGPGCKGARQALFREADGALYAAKDAGRDRVVVHQA